MKFAPERVDVGLAVGNARVLHEVRAGGAVGAVGADEEGEWDGGFGGRVPGRRGYVGCGLRLWLIRGGFGRR